ncbi:toprim domain-containing protein [Salegentibacter agarivorans]|jgi:5S rRNA maturation endonuclease (ribonuclease M5)|uniref:CHC2 zinc finger n=1 Tax=Salegentibacter agarivorans TaxID=345907 RepID=A0A1I2PGZ7_9FLAO|nr:toprim domain-containing protein [Salegentibacter agarivorans]SFG15344.1 CHC2 zinc finger [Salegentibacter agarivorans]|tara:strand:- start:1267 stop:2127 length:861 start_codon:yes stop_codon:yes gene_type:complete
MKEEKLSCEKARNICIVKSLAKLGHFPSRTTEKEAWFLSPLRSETQASFKVSKELNRWYDFGIGEGGNVIDLICLIENCEVKEALQFLNQESIIPTYSSPNNHRPNNRKIQVTAVKPLDHPALLYYLKSRKINVALAGDFCNEVWYQWKEKQYYALGLKNKLGGWELRNKYFKNSSSPKTFSLIENDSKQLLITEGMFDFLSLATIDEDLVQSSDSIILNSLAFIKRIETLIPKYKRVLLYLDNDPAGEKATASLLNQYDHITNRSDSYKDFVDLNDKLKNETDLV